MQHLEHYESMTCVVSMGYKVCGNKMAQIQRVELFLQHSGREFSGSSKLTKPHCTSCGEKQI